VNVVERGVKPESLAVKGLLASKDSPNPADPTVRAVREPAAVGRKDCRQEHELLDSRNPKYVATARTFSAFFCLGLSTHLLST
jgi:hypothetical protein